jgi:glycosyltransferase involved in cell wall biosynthesis
MAGGVGDAGSPLVSVVMPAYNHAAYICDALDSVLHEGYPNLEVVVIDDGSTDNTLAIATEWAAQHMEVPIRIRSQANAGLTRTLNRLVNEADGEYVTYLASDDRLLPGGIARRVLFLEAHPDLSAVFGDSRMINEVGDLVRPRNLSRDAADRTSRDAAAEIVSHWGVMGCVILYRRDRIMKMGGYDESLSIEDWDFYLRLASRGEIAYLDEVVADYRWHGENTVARPEHGIRIAAELGKVAWRSRKLFRGHLYLELVHESASWAARAAWLRGQRVMWLGWKVASIATKLVAVAVPRRPSDQVGERSA